MSYFFQQPDIFGTEEIQKILKETKTYSAIIKNDLPTIENMIKNEQLTMIHPLFLKAAAMYERREIFELLLRLTKHEYNSPSYYYREAHLEWIKILQIDIPEFICDSGDLSMSELHQFYSNIFQSLREKASINKTYNM